MEAKEPMASQEHPMKNNQATKIVFVSVVRDFDTYNRCVRENPNCSGHVFCTFDNREKNEFITVGYNSFLNQYDYSDDAWFVFCHEDFQLLERLEDRLAEADKNCLHGPIGVITKSYFGLYHKWMLQGRIEQSDRMGNNISFTGTNVPPGTPVETFDCLCMIVHSSLIKRTGLRFDEHLSFDLYLEDFCIQAKENHDVKSVILPLRCHHWSLNTIKPRYLIQEKYLNEKWPRVCYTGSCSHILGGGAGMMRKFDHFWKSLIQKLLR